ncbi:MAG: hypothetical protein ABI780_01595, partial [Ardenticatenales bacterium]
MVAGRRLSSTTGRTIVLYDLPDGGSPTELGSFEAPDDIYGMAVGPDDHLYLTDLAHPGLAVIDARVPARPREVGRVVVPDTVGATKHVVVDGTTAYLVTSYGIQSVDVADPTAPRLMATVSGRNDIEAIAVAGGRLVTGYRQGNQGTAMALEWFETGRPDDLPSRGTWTVPGEHYALAAALSGERGAAVGGHRPNRPIAAEAQCADAGLGDSACNDPELALDGMTDVTVVEPADFCRGDPRCRWAELGRLIYEVDPLVSPKCGGQMRVIALIQDPTVIDKILKHLRGKGRDALAGPWAPGPTQGAAATAARRTHTAHSTPNKADRRSPRADGVGGCAVGAAETVRDAFEPGWSGADGR